MDSPGQSIGRKTLKRWIQGLAQLMGIFMALAAMKLVLSVDRLVRWAAGQKSLMAFFAVSVIPVAFILTGVFGLWAGYQWGMIAAGAIVFGGAIAIGTLMVTAGQLARAASTERKVER